MIPLDFLASLRAYGYENEVPNVSAPMGRLLHDLVLISRSSRILELGTANGYSTIWMASALKQLAVDSRQSTDNVGRHFGDWSDAVIHRDDSPDRPALGEYRDPETSSGWQSSPCKLITVDVSEPSYKQAIENIASVGLSEYVELNFGNALEFVPALEDESFDFAFIDARKKHTKEFLRITWPKVKKWGIIMVDDVIKFREKMEGFYEYLEEQEIAYNVLPIDADDGCMMIVKS